MTLTQRELVVELADYLAKKLEALRPGRSQRGPRPARAGAATSDSG